MRFMLKRRAYRFRKRRLSYGYHEMLKESYGKKREREVREIAGRLGVSDFVYFAPPMSKGNAQREVAGDGLLLVGDRGAILQVKTRDPIAGVNDSADRVESWVRKNTSKAVK